VESFLCLRERDKINKIINPTSNTGGVFIFLIIFIYKTKIIMKKTIRLTENDLMKLVKRVVKEQEDEDYTEARKDYDWYKRDDIAPEDLERVLSNSNKKFSDREYQLNQLKERWTQAILNAESEEEVMDVVLNLAELASYRKTKPFK
jgi:CRISPR/Cas system-associated endonuclease Cas3-HD